MSPSPHPPAGGIGSQTPFRWGHLRVLEPLGSGGFGEIYRAYEPKLDREVALKLKRVGRSTDESYVAEARRLARVRHQNVLTVHGVDEFEGRIGLWTELIDGRNLESALERNGPMSPREAAILGMDLCGALSAVHAAGLVHRDVKTSNVMRETGGRTVLMDFGTVTESESSEGSKLVGTPLVMAPELFRGEAPSHRSDLYSLGVLLYRVTTGEYPYSASSLGELEDLMDRGQIVPLRDRRPDLELEFIEVVERALDRNPDRRFQSAGEMERALADLLRDEETRERRKPSAPRTENQPDYDQLIGRSAELGVLQAELDQVLRGVGQTVLVSGEPGVGKTQLSRHFLRWAEERGVRSATARFFDYDGSQRAPYETILDLLADLYEVPDSSRKSRRLAELQKILETRGDGPLPPELFAADAGRELAGDDMRLVVPLADAIRDLSREEPLVLVLDDLQWSDPASREILGYLMRTQTDERLLILGLYRTEEARTGPLAQWLQRQAAYRSFTQLTLRPLSRADCLATIVEVFADPSLGSLPEDDLETLHRVTGGNPYFLAEMLRLLVAEQRLSAGSDGRWTWGGLEGASLPESLKIAAREKLDRLPEGVRTVLEAAAVIGDEFRVDTLSRIVRSQPDDVERHLDAALAAGVARAEGLSPGEDYGFYHTILRRVLYDGLSPRRRRRLHESAADALEKVYANELERMSESISAHHEEAGNLKRALQWSLRSWRAARGRWQWNDGLRSLDRSQRVIELLERMSFEVDPTARLRTLHGRGQAQLALGRLREAERTLERAQTMAQAQERPEIEARCSLERARAHAGLGEYTAGMRCIEAAAALFEELGDREWKNLCRVEEMTIFAATGDHEGVERTTRDVLRSMPYNSSAGAQAAGLLGWSYALRGRTDEGIPLLERAIEHYERDSDLRQRALFVRRLHWTQLMRGNYAEAIRLAEYADALSRSVEDTWGSARAQLGIGQALVDQGLLEEGIDSLEATVDRLADLGDAHCEAETLWLLGRAYGETGRPEEGEELVRRGLEMVERIGDRDDMARMKIDLARLLRRLGQLEESAAVAREAEILCEELENREGLGAAIAEQSATLRAQARPEEALAEIQRANEALGDLESADRWRVRLAEAQALDALDPEGTLEQQIEALERAVAQLDEARSQIERSDRARRASISRARSPIVLRLAQLLEARGDTGSARRLRKRWRVDGETQETLDEGSTTA